MQKEKEKCNEILLPLVKKMTNIPCPILKTGWKKISMDHYFCKTCDKDLKNPICKNCMRRCHRNHIQSKLYKADENTKIICSCGQKCHNLLNEEINLDQKYLSCKFHEFNLSSEIYEYYENQNKVRICTFCFNFCREQNPDHPIFIVPFNKETITKEEFVNGIEDHSIECQCPKLVGNKHRFSIHSHNNIAKLNIPNKNYFPFLTSLHIINFLMETNQLLFLLYSSLTTENFINIVNGNEKKSTLRELSTFSLNIDNCSLSYFSSRIQNLFTPKNTNLLLSMKIINKQEIFDFYAKYLLCYKNVHLKKILSTIPNYSMIDIINLSPFQRYMYYLNSKEVFNKHENIINNLLLFVENIIKIRPNSHYVHSLFPEIFSLLKYYSSRYLLSFEHISQVVRLLDAYFNYLVIQKAATNSNIMDNDSRKLKTKTISSIYKILLYFSFYYNDYNVINYLTSKERKDFPFIHMYNELGRNLVKALIHLLNHVRNELSNLETKLGNQNKIVNQNIHDQKYKNSLIDMVSKTEMLVFIAIEDKDIYLSSLQRSINSNLDTMLILSNEKNNFGKLFFLHFLKEEVENIEQEFYQFFQTPKIKEQLIKIVELIDNSLKHLFEHMEIYDFNLPENKDNFVDFSSDLTFDSTENDSTHKELLNEKIKQKFTKFSNLTKNQTKSMNPSTKIKNEQTIIISQNISYQILMSKSNYPYCITKVFQLTKDKNEFPISLCIKIIKMLIVFINDYPENAIIGLSSPVLNNLSKMPRSLYENILDYIIKGIKILIASKVEIGSMDQIIKYSIKLFKKTTSKSKRNCGTALKNTMSCLLRVIKIMILGYSMIIYDKNKYLELTQEIIENLLQKCTIFSKYKHYLFEIKKDFDVNQKYYYEKKDYDNDSLFNQIFISERNITNNSFQTGVAFNIFVSFIKLINLAFDGNALSSIPQFIYGFLSQKDIITILQIKTLNIALRLELLTFFRMAYIDMLIDTDKMQNYRDEFQNDLDIKVNELDDSLLPTEQLKIFIFLEMLINVSKSSSQSEKKINENESDILLFEISNIQDIINYSKVIDDKRMYLNYFENGILLPIKIFLNKTFSKIMSISGKEFLKIYRFAFYFLQMKHFLLQKNMFTNPSTDKNTHGTNNEPNESFHNNQNINTSAIIEVENDLKKITSPTFQPLNYLIIFEMITKHIMSLIEHPTSKQVDLYFNDTELYDENKKSVFKQYLLKKNINVEIKSTNYYWIWKLYGNYLDQKSNFNQSSIRSILDENYSENEDTYRTVLLKFLFYLTTQKFGNYSERSIQIILNLLKAETTQTQKSVMEIIAKSKLKLLQNPNSHSSSIMTISKKNIDEIINFSHLAESGFKFILSTIYAQYNPTTLEISDDYYSACHIIKLFKFLCEEHNNDFQTIFLKKLYFSINDVKKITYYDMMLFVLEKIIILSSWEKAKSEEEVQDYFYGLFSCIIEMLIEIVQGTEQSNFNNLIKTKRTGKFKFFGSAFDNGEDPILYENGKALKSFLKNIKVVIFNDYSDSETIFSIRKNLMEFILAFIEEYNCPKEIKVMIMNSYHPSSIIKSICVVMKKYYITQRENKLDIHDHNSFMFEDKRVKKKQTNMIIENNLHKSHTLVNNDTCEFREDLLKTVRQKKSDKKLKQLKFNENIYEEFYSMYFENDEFFKSQAFDLCSSFFTYFSLTHLQYQNEETIDFLNKSNSISKEALEDFNNRTNNMNFHNSMFENNNNNTTVRDDFEFESYYVIKFFNQISKKVLVKVLPNKKPVYVVFTMMPYLKYLSSDTKKEFTQNVNRKNRNTKLVDLMEQSEFFRLEIEYNWKHLRTSKFLRKLSDVNYRLLGYCIYMGSIIINIILLFSVDTVDTMTPELDLYLNIVKNIAYLLCAFCLCIIFMWIFSKMKLHFEIEKAKYIDRYKRKNNTLTKYEYLFIGYNAIMKKGELIPFLYYIVCSIISIFSRRKLFTHALSLFIVIFLSRTLKNLALSLFIKGNQFMWTSLFTFVLLYVFGGWGFYFLRERFYDTVNRDKPDHMCESLLYCFLTEINNGLRWHLGIGKVLLNESGILRPASFVHRWFYDFVFYLLNYTLMLHIVFGFVIDSFRELRKKHLNIKKDLQNKCFICNMDKDECEKNNKNFKEHCENEHNLWDYAFYMITLRMKDIQDLNSVNSKCRDLIFDKQIQWLPDESDCFCENDNESDEEKEEHLIFNESDTDDIANDSFNLVNTEIKFDSINIDN